MRVNELFLNAATHSAQSIRPSSNAIAAVAMTVDPKRPWLQVCVA
jgi:hypothetical protein